MLRILCDTSVWLDLAKRRDGQKWIVAIRVLALHEQLELLVPAVVVDEFERNRERIKKTMTVSVSDRFKQLRQDVTEFGGEDRQSAIAYLDGLRHQVPFIGAMTTRNFTDIAELLQKGTVLEPTTAEHERVVRRGLEKKAPLHLDKNSVADALLIELYASAVASGDLAVDQYRFATSNHDDFSRVNGDRREPHPDIADVFDGEASRYVYQLEGLVELLSDHFGEEFEELVEESDFVEEPRTLDEILEAEHEFFDKIWYVRTLIRQEKIDAGEAEAHPPALAAQIDVNMRKIEERYGKDNVGPPWDDWRWGFVHGKLSALRWVLGSEWDFLDT